MTDVTGNVKNTVGNSRELDSILANEDFHILTEHVLIVGMVPTDIRIYGTVETTRVS